MKSFKFTNSKIHKIIIENYRNNENIYLFENRVNNFFKLINENFSNTYIFDVKSDTELFKLPVEETYNLIENMQYASQKTIELILNITAYKLNLYFNHILKGLNEEDFFPYFPSIRGVLEHICFSYKILFESKKYLDLMNIRNENSEKDIIDYIKNHDKAKDILRIFIFGTKNKDLIEDGVKDNRIDKFSAYNSIKYVKERTKYKNILEEYKFFSELTHPSSFNTNYFLEFNKNSSTRLVNNTRIIQNDEKSIYSLKSNSSFRQFKYFEEIIHLLTNSIELFEEIFEIFNVYKIKLPDLEILKNSQFKEDDDLKKKEFLESEDFLNKLRDTVKKNKFKSSENIDKETEKIIKKKDYEIRKNK